MERNLEAQGASEVDSVVENVCVRNICCWLIARCSDCSFHIHNMSHFKDIGCNSMDPPRLNYAKKFKKYGYIIT